MNLYSSELRIFDLLVPWAFGIGVLGFIVAWAVTTVLEWTGLTRFVWHVPLFFLGLFVLVSCVLGLCLQP